MEHPTSMNEFIGLCIIFARFYMIYWFVNGFSEVYRDAIETNRKIYLYLYVAGLVLYLLFLSLNSVNLDVQNPERIAGIFGVGAMFQAIVSLNIQRRKRIAELQKGIK